MITFVFGGARSGKSAYAEKLIEEQGGGIYLATSEIWDEEMQARVNEHQIRRNDMWKTIEEPIEIAPIIEQASQPMLVDCLTLWISNLMANEYDIAQETEKLCQALMKTKSHVVIVSNEVGLGIVPDNALARSFRDYSGRVNQAVAQVAHRVLFIAAGLPLILKDEAYK